MVTPVAGRELDALVDERVMDWAAPRNGEAGLIWNKEEDAWYQHGKRIRTADKDPIPSYSTSIAAAWEVVMHLIAVHHPCPMKYTLPGMGFKLEINAESEWSDDTCFRWSACFPNITAAPPHEEMHHDWKACADTAPLAICLAALKAMGVEGFQ